MKIVDTVQDNHLQADKRNLQQPINFYIQSGSLLLQQGSIEEGIKVLQKSIEFYPIKSEGYIALADALAEQKDIAGAIVNYQQAINLQNEVQPLWIYRQLIKWLLEQEELEKAIELAKKAINLYPKKAGAYISLAEIFEKQDNIIAAINNYQKAFEINPKQPTWVQKNLKNCQSKLVNIQGVNLFINHSAISENLKAVFRQRRYEAQEVKILKKVINANDNIIEIGGGVGFLSIYVKKKFPNITISSYEANPNLIDLIKKNQELNNCLFPIKNVILDDCEGETDFFVAKNFWASSVVKKYNGATTIKVQKANVNQAIIEQGANFLIIDIEGNEKDLIPKINFDYIQKILVEIHPKIIGNEGVSLVLRSLLNKGFVFDVSNSVGHVYYFYKKNLY